MFSFVLSFGFALALSVIMVVVTDEVDSNDDDETNCYDNEGGDFETFGHSLRNVIFSGWYLELSPFQGGA